MQRKSYSLTRRIVGLVSIPVVISGLAIGALALGIAWHEIEEIYDAQLIHASKVLRQLTSHELTERRNDDVDLIPEIGDLGYKYEQNIAIRIWRNNELIIRSKNAVEFGDLHVPPGLSDQTIGDDKWRFFVYVDPAASVTVETAERYHIRYEVVSYLLLGLLLPASLFVPVVLVLVWFGTRRGLAPLSALSRDIDQRHSNDLTRIEPEKTPREIDALVTALNRLFTRLKDALERERDFTDNAAHELRTPLAAIKTQAQALRPRVATIPGCQESLANLLRSTNRAAHLVDKLLDFSRLQKTELKHQQVELLELLENVASDFADEAHSRNLTLGLDASVSPAVAGDSHALEIMIRNLVENAIKYTESGGEVVMALDETDAGAVIRISDSGPGIADDEKQRVMQRFYRIASRGATGSGLGLAIVKWIVEQHHAEFTLSDVEPHGLCCTITFPKAEAA
ncbi:MAG: two-component sensor histidine kinase [marine bacterium B5-7]|nr:MAG: two-component sensor histidine kinase [marine bacterium B5-7]